MIILSSGFQRLDKDSMNWHGGSVRAPVQSLEALGQYLLRRIQELVDLLLPPRPHGRVVQHLKAHVENVNLADETSYVAASHVCIVRGCCGKHICCSGKMHPCTHCCSWGPMPWKLTAALETRSREDARALSVGCLQRASAISISSIMPLMFLRLMRLMASLLTITLVQNGFIAADRLALHRPPGGLYAQHRTSAGEAQLHKSSDLSRHDLTLNDTILPEKQLLIELFSDKGCFCEIHDQSEGKPITVREAHKRRFRSPNLCPGHSAAEHLCRLSPKYARSRPAGGISS